jgi:hypothetical protein
MKYPEIVVLPLLMLSDHFLTILGAVQKDKGYSDHFKTEHYELNPIWQKSVNRKAWLDPRHLLLTVLATYVLAGILEFGDTPAPFAEGVFGFLFVCFGMVIGRHLSNILLFRRVARKPEEITGQVVMAHSLALSSSAYQYLIVAVPIVMIAIFNPTGFTIGSLAGAIMIFVVHFFWLRKHNKKASAMQEANREAGAVKP